MVSIPLKPIIEQLEQIRRQMIAEEWTFSGEFGLIQPHYRDSAKNLLHYLTLRTFDLRHIQENLSSLGLSSVGHSERYTLTNITNILHLLHLLDGKQPFELESTGIRFSLSYPLSKQQLVKHTEELFGPEREPGKLRIMLTLPSEAATDYDLVKSYLEEEVEILRINCSHDDEDGWLKMIQNIRKAETELNVAPDQRCLIYMDLAGPKLRTGQVNPMAPDGTKEKKKGGYLLLKKNDKLIVKRQMVTGDYINGKAVISTTLPEVFDDVKTGQSIVFDDGKISGIVESAGPEEWTVRITHAGIDGSKLRADKGINLPDSTLNLPSLTAYDEATLPFIVQHADLVGFSFVRRPEDVASLQKKLKKLNREDIGIILKIETRESFDNLPNLLIQAMQSPRFGVMIARGDLAVEVGWSRFAEVQEQIAWLCEAAHIPYIWATQILETLAKKGVATRAEITDASMAVRAECAMLNKGPYILEAIRTLRNIDNRMIAHHQKKMGSLRPLHVAQRFFLPEAFISII